uniref:Uncharacterized protein n=1 Tax=Tanacetum cinerariifolium TaxID=118510 RepID=A0A699J387_TANCI|nr:hypothetical protein [Tanacetum cinerariifolium]
MSPLSSIRVLDLLARLRATESPPSGRLGRLTVSFGTSDLDQAASLSLIHRLPPYSNTTSHLRKAKTTPIANQPNPTMVTNHENVRMNVPWILVQYLSKKAVGLRETSDINGGQYVSRLAHNLGYFTPNRIRKCLAPVEGSLLDKESLKGILDHAKMRLKENDVGVAGSKPNGKERNNSYTFAFDYNPPMVPPYLFSTTPFIEMDNVLDTINEHAEEPLNEDEDI